MTDYDLTPLNHYTLGILCRTARERSGMTLQGVAEAIGRSKVTVHAWERRSDLRLVEFWQERGFVFPERGVATCVVQLGKLRTFSVGGPIVDHGVRAVWSGMTMRRKNNEYEFRLDEHEYDVDEATGTYRFSQRLHGRRSVAVSFTRS